MGTVAGALLFSLGLTLAVELIVAALLGVRGWDLVIIGLINCLTNPLVNFLYDCAWIYGGKSPLIPVLALAVLEIAVLFTEALLFHKLLIFRRIGGVWLSLILNGASFAAGELFVFIRMLI